MSSSLRQAGEEVRAFSNISTLRENRTMHQTALLRRISTRALRGSVLALLLALVVTAADPGTQPARADIDSCKVSLDVPAKIAIDRPYKAVKVKVFQSCYFDPYYASIKEYGPRGLNAVFIFDWEHNTDIWDIYSYQALGTYRTRLGAAYDSNGYPFGFESSTTVIKLGSKASLSTRRSGSYVHLSVNSKAWSPNSDKFIGWNSNSAKIQYSTKSGWKTIKTVKLTKGKATVKVSAKHKRTYRFITASDGSHWGSTSKSSRR
jgi:hypothetical protein